MVGQDAERRIGRSVGYDALAYGPSLAFIVTDIDGHILPTLWSRQRMKQNIKDWTDEEEIKAYLRKLLHKEAFDRAGLIYGMGHAVYSQSDPRAKVFKGFVEKLSSEKGRHEEFALYSLIERLAPEVIAEERRIYKGVCANVDFYSGFVYRMLGIPDELFTPLFATSRIAGWSAHRIEELINSNKIIRPAYKAISPMREYTDMENRID